MVTTAPFDMTEQKMNCICGNGLICPTHGKPENTPMTDQEINVKIAEACGWTDPVFIDDEGFQPHWKAVRPNPDWNGNPVLMVPPDYCNDLNDMHELEMSLKSNGGIYRDHLYDIVDSDLQANKNYPNPTWAVHATARQRAKAFLKTLEL